MAVTNTSASVKLSFADVVKGSTTPSPLPALQPGRRGEKRCFCQGEVLVMLGHYGWIMTFDAIDHADIGMTAGRVYVHKRDVEHGVSLAQGDIVSFYLYSDDQGLGAESCRVDQSAPRSLCADADEFVPRCLGLSPSWNTSAAEFVPMPTTIPSCFNMAAAEFVPSNFSAMNANVFEFMPATVCSNALPSHASITAINLAFLSDSDDESDEEPSTVSSGCFDADKESNGDDTDISCYNILDSLQQDSALKSSSDLHAAGLHAPWRKLSQASLDDDSTSRKPWRKLLQASLDDDSTSRKPWRKLSEASSGDDSTSWKPWRKLSQASLGDDSTSRKPWRKLSQASLGDDSSSRKPWRKLSKASLGDDSNSRKPWRKLSQASLGDDSISRKPWRNLSKASLGDDSTSAGGGSDSEEEQIVHCVVRAPPGLSLPAAWRAPPGLSLPALVA